MRTCRPGSVLPQEVELTDTRLQHLVGMEACIFAEQRTRERSDERLRLNGTPSFFINGRQHEGTYEFSDLVSAIDSHLSA
jgi:protein-disulfide isomerase